MARNTAPIPVTPSAPAQRRAPTQQRSRERVERMLGIATALIAENGSDALRMSDVAEQAGVSIGSLYQYFPDKGAIIRTLAERYNAQGRICVATALKDVQDAAGLERAMIEMLDGYYAMFLSEPVMRDIWSGTQADKALLDLDAADGRAHGAMLAAALLRLKPEAVRSKPRHAEIDMAAFLMMQLTAATVRLAISLPRADGDALIKVFKRLRPWAHLLDL